MVEPEESHGYRIKAEQQSDGTWKAWAIVEGLVAYGATEVKALCKVVTMILGNDEEDDEEE